MATVAGKRQSPVKYLCGTPPVECSGSADGRFGVTPHKLHSSINEARLCFVRYLIRDGWTRLSSNTWQRGDEPIKVA